ncbi:MAG: PHP domain-containing protein [Oscillospiraceae bacterium]|nr:PHP domain-containing protein [Oscillospiraceae bacterium]
MYKYETHLHTKEGSACASAPAADMARAHKAAGYDGIFVTDHFFNANTAVPRDLPWEERIDRFFLGYERAKAVGDEIGLKVWFGFEYTVYNADLLIYNMSKEWMKANEQLLMHTDERECFRTIRESGGFIVHAHPFRYDPYIHHISLYPNDVDAVEVINASHDPRKMYNERAKLYADSYGLIKTGGSDSHHLDKLFGGGIDVPEPINCPEDYLRLLREGKVYPRERTLK